MKRLLSTMTRGLGPDALDSLVSSIQHASESRLLREDPRA